MLIVKGWRVAFDLKDGGEAVVRPSSGMMHDPSGRDWPRCSLLVGPFRRGGAADPEEESFEQAQSYLGRATRVCRGVVERPPRELVVWRRIGAVDQIWYTRFGSRYRGKFRHPFNQPGILTRIFKGKGRPPILYAHRSFLRLEMQSGCMVDTRGIAWP